MIDIEKIKQAALNATKQFKVGSYSCSTIYAIEANPSAVLELINRLESAESQLETERMRLVACGVAALGYFDGCEDEFKSASLDDTLRLRESNNELRQQLSAAEKERMLRDALNLLYSWANNWDSEFMNDPDWKNRYLLIVQKALEATGDGK